MALNDTINELGNSIINLVDKKTHRGLMALDYGEVGYDKEVFEDIRKYKHSTFDISKFTVNLADESPEDYIREDGVFFARANRVYTGVLKRCNTSADIFIKITTDSDITTRQRIFGGGMYFNLIIDVVDGKIGFYTGTWNSTVTAPTDSTYTAQADTTYYLHWSFDGTNTYKLEVSTDDENWTVAQTYVDPDDKKYLSSIDYNVGYIARLEDKLIEYPFKGTFDLTYHKIYKNDVLVEDYNTLLTDGFNDPETIKSVSSFKFDPRLIGQLSITNINTLKICIGCYNREYILEKPGIALYYFSAFNNVTLHVNDNNKVRFAVQTARYDTYSLVSNTTIEVGKKYFFEGIYDNGIAVLKIYDENYTLLEEKSLEVNLPIFEANRINKVYIFPGTDLKCCSVEVDNVEVFNGNKTGIDVYKETNLNIYPSDATNINEKGIFEIPLSAISSTGTSSVIVSKLGGVSLQNVKNITLEYEGNAPTNGDATIISLYDNVALKDMGMFFSNNGSSIKMRHYPTANDINFSQVCAPGSWVHIKGRMDTENNLYTLWVTQFGKTTKYEKSSECILPQDSTQMSLFCGSTVHGQYAWSALNTAPKLINLSSVKVYINDELVWQPMLRIPYTETKAGYRIAPYEWRSCLEQIKEEKGVAPYYTINENEEENFIRRGTPTINNKVASDFTWSNYFISTATVPMDKSFKFDIGGIVGPLNVDGGYFLGSTDISGQTDVPFCGEFRSQQKISIPGVYIFQFWDELNGFWYQEGDTFKFTVYRNKESGVYGVICFKNGVQINHLTHESSSNLLGDTNIVLGIFKPSWASVPFTGSIDLTKCKLYVEDKLVWTPYLNPSYTLPMGDVYSVLSAKANSSEIANYAMPSDIYTNLTLGESGTTYTAPANGYFSVSKTAGDAGRWMSMKIKGSNVIESTQQAVSSDTVLTCFIPVRKDEEVQVNYSATGTTNYFIFVYAEGSKGEKQ